MPALTIPLKRLTDADITLPVYQTAGAAGMDLPAAITDPITLNSGERRLIPCGFALAIPEGFEAQIRPRSGLANRFGITVLNAPGTIDSDYRGEVSVLLVNLGADAFTITRGERVAQLVVAPVARVEWQAVSALPDTTRGGGGFGHTGS
jgi:dUTP pyrophosphatase